MGATLVQKRCVARDLSRANPRSVPGVPSKEQRPRHEGIGRKITGFARAAPGRVGDASPRLWRVSYEFGRSAEFHTLLVEICRDGRQVPRGSG